MSIGTGDFAPMLTRIEEILCDGRGVSRALASADRFRVGPFPDQLASNVSKEASVRKAAFAWLETSQPLEHPEQHPRAKYTLTIALELYYYLPEFEQHSYLRTAAAVAASDMHKVRGALCYPGNVDATEAGALTGLVSGMLEFVSWSSQLDLENNLLVGTMRLRGIAIHTFST